MSTNRRSTPEQRIALMTEITKAATRQTDEWVVGAERAAIAVNSAWKLLPHIMADLDSAEEEIAAIRASVASNSASSAEASILKNALRAAASTLTIIGAALIVSDGMGGDGTSGNGIEEQNRELHATLFQLKRLAREAESAAIAAIGVAENKAKQVS